MAGSQTRSTSQHTLVTQAQALILHDTRVQPSRMRCGGDLHQQRMDRWPRSRSLFLYWFMDCPTPVTEQVRTCVVVPDAECLASHIWGFVPMQRSWRHRCSFRMRWRRLGVTLFENASPGLCLRRRCIGEVEPIYAGRLGNGVLFKISTVWAVHAV